MHVSRIFTSALAVSMPVLAMFRTPRSEDTGFNPRPLQPRDNSTDSATTAQVELTSALGDLLDLIDSIRKLLTPGFFDNVNSSITNLADLLAPPFVNNPRTIVGRAGTLLDDIQPLIDKFKDFDLNSLIQLIAPIVVQLSSLLDNASKLLTTGLSGDISTLITQLAPVCFKLFIWIHILQDNLHSDWLTWLFN